MRRRLGLVVATVLATVSCLLSLGPGVVVASPLRSGAWCGTVRPLSVTSESAPTIQAYIAYPAGAQVDLQAQASFLQRAFARNDDLVRQATGGTKGLRVRTGGAGCDTNYIDIVSIPLRSDTSTFGQGVAQVSEASKSLGGMSLLAGTITNAPSPSLCGLGGRVTPIDVSAPVNPAFDFSLDAGAYAAVVETCSGESPEGDARSPVLLHEIFHAMGSVDPQAPHYGSAGHVVERGDLMAARPDTDLGPFVDVGGDDYFAPGRTLLGRTGSPIWNVADSLYLCHAADCTTQVTRPSVAVSSRTISTDVLSGEIEYTARGAHYFRWLVDGRHERGATGSSIRRPQYSYSSLSVQGVDKSGALSVPVPVPTLSPPETVPSPGIGTLNPRPGVPISPETRDADSGASAPSTSSRACSPSLSKLKAKRLAKRRVLISFSSSCVEGAKLAVKAGRSYRYFPLKGKTATVKTSARTLKIGLYVKRRVISARTITAKR